MSKRINITIPEAKDVASTTKKGWNKTKGIFAGAKDKVAIANANSKKKSFEKLIFSDTRSVRVTAMETVIQYTKGEGQVEKFRKMSDHQQDQVIAQFQAQLDQEKQMNTNNKEDNK